MSDPSTSRAESLEAAKLIATMFGDKSTLEAIEDGREFKWFPQQDIAVYELALSQYLLGLIYAGKDWRLQQRTFDSLPPEVQRHFRVKNQADQEQAAQEQADD
jgi:hypothetical protein